MNESSKANDHGTPESEEPEIIEPELGAANISEDVAETVDLAAAEAEAAAVAHEAELAALRSSPALRKSDAGVAAPAAGSPDVSAAPDTLAGSSASELSGTTRGDGVANVTPNEGAAADAAAAPADATPADAAAEGAAPEESGAESTVAPPKELGHIGPGIDDGHGWRRPEAQWQQSSTPWKPKAGAWQSPSQISRNAADAQAAEALAQATGDQTSKTSQPQTPTVGNSATGSTAATGPASPRQPTVPGAATMPPSVPGGPGSAAVPPTPGTPDIAGSGSGSDSNPKKILIVAGIVLLGLALLALLIILLVGLFTGDKNSTGALPANSGSSQAQQSVASKVTKTSKGTGSDLIVASVSPLDWLEGDCLRDFTDTSTSADVVLCSSPHNAQLVGTYYYKDSDVFPGLPSLKVKAAEVCKGVAFTSEASGLQTLKQTPAYPSEATWKDKNDRRVDCLVHDTRSGNPLDITLTQ